MTLNNYFRPLGTVKLEPPPFKPTIKNGRICLVAPKEFCIYVPHFRDHTLKYLGVIGEFTINEKKSLHLDFSEIRLMTAAATVMLFAEVTRAQIATNQSDIISLTLPRDPNQRHLFIHTGLFNAIKPGGLKKLDKLSQDESTYQSGIDPHAWSLPVAMALNEYNLSRQQKNIFSRGVQEAMLNVIHHAYDNKHEPLSGIGRRWWHAIYNNKETGKLVMIIYDKGQGIPNSMSKQSFPFYHQGEIIRHVLPKGVTRFIEQPERGKGTQDIIQAMEIKDNSLLMIYSDKGSYIREHDGKEIECAENPISINGTLVEWQIPYRGIL